MSQFAVKSRNLRAAAGSPKPVSLFGLITAIMLAVFLATSLFESASRVIGTIIEEEVLIEAVFIQAFSVLVAGAVLISTFTFGAGKTGFVFIYTTAFLSLTALVLTHLMFSPPAQPNAWNTIPFELSRSLVLGCFILALFNLMRARRMPKVLLSRTAKAFLIVCFLLVIVAILQRFNQLPNFYFQWYNGRLFARPAGGFEHPHFFAMLLVLACATTIVAWEKKLIGKPVVALALLVFLSGIWFSTSRVGFVSAVAFFVSYGFFRLDLKRIILNSTALIFTTILAILIIALNWDSISQWQTMKSVEVFLSAFIESFSTESSGGQFLRGRDERWAHEISLITATPQTLLIGYGHQPFVSHNLILRQLQVSGVLGSICYLVMLITAGAFWISRLRRSDRAPIYALFVAISVGSITFPVLVSTAIVSGLVVLAAVTIGLSHSSDTRWHRPFSATP